MTLNDLLSTKKGLLDAKQKLLNGLKTQESDIKLFVINVALDQIEKQISAVKDLVTYQ